MQSDYFAHPVRIDLGSKEAADFIRAELWWKLLEWHTLESSAFGWPYDPSYVIVPFPPEPLPVVPKP